MNSLEEQFVDQQFNSTDVSILMFAVLSLSAFIGQEFDETKEMLRSLSAPKNFNNGGDGCSSGGGGCSGCASGCGGCGSH